MGIATPPLPPIFSQEQSISTTHKPNSANSMSQDYHHQGIFSFSNGFERSAQQEQQQQQQQQQHIAQQIRRDKLRVQGYEPPPPLVAIDEEESGGLNPVYETAGMLSEMFNFPPGAELLEQQQIPQNYHRSPQRPQPPPAAASNMEWYRQGMATVGGLGPLEISTDSKNHHHHHHHQHNQNINNRQISNINAESAAAAMQLFLMNPQPRSPSPPPPPATSSTLHMLLPNPSSNSLQGFHQVGSVIQPPSQFTWVPDSGDHGHEGSHTTHSSAASQLIKFGEIGGVVEGQGLSLSLSSSLQHLEAAKAEELRMGDGTAAAMLFFNQGGSGAGAGAGQSSSSSHNYPYKNIQNHQSMHLQGGSVGHQNHQVHVGFGSSIGVVNVMRNSRYVKAAQELLEEFCSVGRGQFKKNKFGARHNNTNPNSNPSASGGSGGGGGGSSSSSKDLPPLSASDRIEHQRRKVKLLSMLDEVDRRYNHYCEQMQMVVNSFDLVMGFGAAVPYTALAQKAMSRHFRCLKDAISAQLKHSYEVLGEKDGAGSSGVTKGETPRLRMLEQSLRQQRAFHQMGMMEQEAWRPQRGLPERSVNILRAWLFEHFLHPYPSDADKHLLARQTGLSRNQVSNWFINARVRLWKPMVEEMYQQESKEDDQEGRDIDDDDDEEERERSQSSSGLAQTPTPTTTTITTTASATGKRSEINATESDPSSLIAINRHCFSENQAKQAAPPNSTTTTTNHLPPPVSQCFGSTTTHESELHHHHHHHHNNNRLAVDDTCRRGSIIAAADHYGTTSAGGNGNVHHADIGSTLIRFGTTAGDVSLTLGLRHAGNMAGDKPFFS